MLFTATACGPVTLDTRYGNGASKTTLDYYMPSTQAPITITSVYNGVDYRTANNARLILRNPINMILSGDTTFENMDICTMPNGDQISTRTIDADGHKVPFGRGINTYVLNEDGSVNAAAPTRSVFYAGDYYQPTGLTLKVTTFGAEDKTIIYSPADTGFTFSMGQKEPLTAGSGRTVKTAERFFNFTRQLDLSALMDASAFSALGSGSYNLKVTVDTCGAEKVLVDLSFKK